MNAVSLSAPAGRARRGLRAAGVVAAGVVAVATSCVRTSPLAVEHPAAPLLDRAWAFAQAITNDAKDRALSQEQVALAWLDSGDTRRAAAAAGKIENWRHGAVCARLAIRLAEQGHRPEAEAQLQEAEAQLATAIDWQRDRIRLFVAEARVLLGAEQDFLALRHDYEADPLCRARIDVLQALRLARQGDRDAALAAMAKLGEERHYDALVVRARGYLQMAEDGRFARERHGEVLRQAWDAAERIQDWGRWDLQFEAIDAWLRLGQRDEAVRRLETLSTPLAESKLPGHVLFPVLGRTAQRWGRAGCPEQLALLWDRVRTGMTTELQSIERPAVLAQFGEAYVLAGDRARAADFYAHALDEALRLRNLRPRALAGVEIALSLHRCGFTDPRVMAGLDLLRETF